MKDPLDSILSNIPPNTGKCIGDSLWVHASVVEPGALKRLHETIQTEHFVPPEDVVIRIDKRSHRIAHLHYPDFLYDAHPTLCCSALINTATKTVTLQSFANRSNRLILHRKELLVGRNHPAYTVFAALTSEEERLGLLHEKRRIGWSNYWGDLLRNRGLIIEGHEIRKLKTDN